MTFFRRSTAVFILVMLAVMGSVPSPGAAGDTAEAWSEELRQARAAKDDAAIVAALAGRAEALMALGFLARAEADLLEALDRVGPDADPVRILRLRGLLGAVRTRIGDIDGARADLGEALLAASLAGERRLEAVTLNNIGNFLLLERRFGEAIRVYEESASIAGQTGDAETALAARLNAAEVLVRQREFTRAAEHADRAAEMLAEPAADAAQIGALIKLGRLNQAIAAGAPRLTRSQGRAAHRHFAAARQHAASLGDQRLGSFAAGYFGGLYERAGRWQEAQRLTNEAIRLAQRSQSDDTLYVWHWQLGRILRAQGDRPAAIAAHQSAIEALSLVRSDIVAGFGTGRDIFEETVRPLILDLADLLLQQAERARGDEQQRLLSAARETVELLKAAEYEDFFHDDCLAALQAQRRSLDVLPEGTAVLYPVVLADRVVLILGGPNGLSQFAAAAGTTELDRAVAMLRSGLSDAKSTRFRAQARQLYRWLIAPVEEALARTAVDTLVVVPTGALASIPFAALMDGDEFLIQKYAIAVAPGLSLIDSDPLADRRIEALVGGLTESVAGFPALPHVASELADVGSRFPSKVLRDDDLIRDDLIELLDRVPYGVVHLATHAKFEAEASESFLLTYDGRIDMDGLEQMVRQSRFRDQPIELLTLSACSTAEGDARAALGLAGIALKSGARSALASLWLVNDRSTADLVSRFYAGLVAPGATKAKALRQAQLALIASVDYDHPAYWSPFIIIGNWK